MKMLIAGWFSFEQMGASAGDLLARDLVCDWLSEAGYDYDIAVAPPFQGGIAWDQADPGDYTAIIFICGPFGNGPPITDFLPHFAGLPLVGMNLTMLQDLDEWNPFDLLIERDSSEAARPDLVFLADQPRVPVVGLILVHPQAEYRERARHQQVNEALERLMKTRELAVVPIDTRLDENQLGLRTPREVESLIARMDVIITTRLHGMVMALKNGIPPLVVDPIAGGAKIVRQAKAIGWDTVLTTDNLKDEDLQRALDYCLSDEGRTYARAIQQGAVKKLSGLREDFLEELDKLTLAET